MAKAGGICCLRQYFAESGRVVAARVVTWIPKCNSLIRRFITSAYTVEKVGGTTPLARGTAPPIGSLDK